MVETVPVGQERPPLVPVHDNHEVWAWTYRQLEPSELRLLQHLRGYVAVREDLHQDWGQFRDLLLLEAAYTDLETLNPLHYSLAPQEEGTLASRAEGLLTAWTHDRFRPRVRWSRNIQLGERDHVVFCLQKPLGRGHAGAALLAHIPQGQL